MRFLFRTRVLLFLLIFSVTEVFSQDAHKQVSLNFINLVDSARYPQAYTMFDTVVKKNITEYYFKNTWQSVLDKLGKLKDYEFSWEEQSNLYMITYTTCHFENNTLDLKLVFNDRDKIVGFFFVPPTNPKFKYKPPMYDKPELYTEKEIVITTNKFHMPGILTLPNSVKKPPVVILVHGSGPNDEDESIGPNKTFRDIVVGLAAQGIATIRYEKRTKVYGKNIVEAPAQITVRDETMDDVISAVKLASGLPDVDSSKIYILGHSLGAMLAPRIAEECSNIKGVIMLAGNARPLLDLIPEQMNYIASTDTISDTVGRHIQMEKLEKQITRARSNDLMPNTPDSLLPFNVDAMYWIYLNHYDQVKTAEELTVPMLIMQGERDYQVTMTDFNIWKDNLSKKPTVQFKTYPKLNHFFMEGEGKCTPSEYDKPANVPDYVISDIANWINKK